MNDDTLFKTSIGCIAVIIITPFIWHNYQQYREQEEAKAQYLRVCGMLKGTRNEVIRRQQAGEPISSLEASGAYRIGLMTPEDCTRPLD